MKLHLGCGKRYLPGFTHVDIADFAHIEYRNSVSQLTFLKDESIQEIYTSHTLEYFDRIEISNVLAEWFRVLKPGAHLFITVPDFDQLIKIYNDSRQLTKIIGPLFGRWMNPNEQDPIFHKTVWNFNDLSEQLVLTGFEAVRRFDPISYLENIDPEYDDHSLAFYPHMDKNGIQVSLAISCKRPES